MVQPMKSKRRKATDQSFKFGLNNRRIRIMEAVVGGIALGWLVACLTSWIIQIIPNEWFMELTNPTASFATMLMFMGFCSFFAISVAAALREGSYGLYAISSFNAFWIIFVALAYIYGLYAVVDFFFNNGILCMVQIMITYTTSIFTLSDISAISIRKADSYIIGIIPFLALLVFLLVEQQVLGQQTTFGTAMEPILWTLSVIIAALIGYVIHAAISK